MAEQTNKIELSIVIPAFCEEARLGVTLNQLAAYLGRDEWREVSTEVIVAAADGDRTAEVALECASSFERFSLIRTGRPLGKGRDVQAGILAARGCYILFMDADLATPLWHIRQFYLLGRQGKAVVAGTRAIGRYRRNWLRIGISLIGNVLFRLAGGVWLEDSQCGFKLFSRSAAWICFGQLETLGWGFDMEVLARARSRGIPISTVRLDDWRDIPGGTFQRGLLPNSLVALRDLTHIFLMRLNGRYALAGEAEEFLGAEVV